MALQILTGDCRTILPTLPEQSVHCCVTSPPYFGLRDYGCDGQIGLEKTPAEYVAEMVKVFREVRRVLRDDGTLWLNLGDSYVANGSNQVPQTKCHTGSGYAGPNRNGNTGLKPKNMLGIPWRVAFALQQDGWYLRSDIIWSKPNPMPESVTDRPTKAHEYIFLLSKSARYHYEADAIREKCTEESIARAARNSFPNEQRALSFPGQPSFRDRGEGTISLNANGRNRRSVWTIPTQPYGGAHFAAFPEKLIEPCILAGCPEGGTVLDPFGGSGTTGRVAVENRRSAILIELNPEYVSLQRHRTSNIQINVF